MGRIPSRSPPTRSRSIAGSRSSPAQLARPNRNSWSIACCRSCPSTRRSAPDEYAHRAHAEIDGLLAAGRRPIVVGGTGLYLRAALADLDLRPPVPAAVRERRRTDLQERGAPALHAELAARDAAAAAAVLPSDTQRLVRALELLDAGHAPPAGPQLWTAETRHPTLLAGLTMEREALKARIDERVRAMVAAGAADEVRAAAAAGASTTVRKALGFQELLAGDVDAMQRSTRRYARRQLTWMRKLPDVLLLDTTDRAPGAGRDRAARRATRSRGMIRRCASRSGRPSATTT